MHMSVTGYLQRASAWGLVIASVCASGCANGCFVPTSDDVGGGDSGRLDGGRDGGTALGTDAGFDAGLDAGFDGGRDAGFDGGRDAGFDGGRDAGFDAGMSADSGLLITSFPSSSTCTDGLAVIRQRPPDCGDGGPCLVIRRQGEPARALASSSLNGLEPTNFVGASDGWAVFATGASPYSSVAARRIEADAGTAQTYTIPLPQNGVLFHQFETGPTRRAIDVMSSIGVIGGSTYYVLRHYFTLRTSTTPPTLASGLYGGGPTSVHYPEVYENPEVHVIDPVTVNSSTTPLRGSLAVLNTYNGELSPALILDGGLVLALPPGSTNAAMVFPTSFVAGGKNEWVYSFGVSPLDGTHAFLTYGAGVPGLSLWVAAIGASMPSLVRSGIQGGASLHFDPSGEWLYFEGQIGAPRGIFRVNVMSGKDDLVLPTTWDDELVRVGQKSGLIVSRKCGADMVPAFINTTALTATWLYQVPGFPAEPQGDYALRTPVRYWHNGTDAYWIVP